MSMIMQWVRVTPREAGELTGLGEEALFDWFEENDDRVVDVDKAWHGVHAVLTDSDWSVEGPLGQLVLGGTEFGEDGGYGPPRLLQPAEVAAAAEAARNVSADEFRARIDFGRLQRLDIYPSIWDRTEEHGELVPYLTESFTTVRQLFLDAADHGDAVIILCT